MLMGLSLLAASAAWAGLVFAHNVLDENQSGRLSARIMDHEGVRTVLTNRLAEGMERHVPVDEPMSRQELRSVAAEALTGPLAVTALRDGLSEAHLLGLADAEAEPTFSDFDVNEAARQALIAARPSLRDRILVNPLVKVRLPVEGLTWFSGLKTLADRFAVLALAMAAVGFATSFVVAEEPTPVLRRAAWWILTSAGVWTLLGPGFAAIVRLAVPSSYIVFAVAIETVLHSMLNPAIVMASFGVGLLSVSYLAPAIGRRRGALLLEQARGRLGADRRPIPTTAPAPSAAATAAAGPTGVSDPGSSPAAADSTPGERSPVTVNATVNAPLNEAQFRSGSVGSRLSAAWKEGHGYLDDARVAPFFSGSTREP